MEAHINYFNKNNALLQALLLRSLSADSDILTCLNFLFNCCKNSLNTKYNNISVLCNIKTLHIFQGPVELIYEGDIQGMDGAVLSPLMSGFTTDDSSQVEHNPRKKRRTSMGKTDKIESLMETAANTLRGLTAESADNSNVLFSQ